MVKLIGEPLFQWDTGRKVSVTPAEGVEIQEVHFANTGDSKAIPIAVENGEANIPDVLLQTGKTVAAYAVEILDGRERAVYELFLPVRERPKPGDYVYTEAEMAISELEKLTAAAGEATKAAEDVAAELRQARENGEFVGPQGEPGNATIDDGRVSKNYTWSSEKIDDEVNGREGGRPTMTYLQELLNELAKNLTVQALTVPGANGNITIKNGEITVVYQGNVETIFRLGRDALLLNYKNLKIINGRAQIGYGLNSVTGTLGEGTSNNSSLGWKTQANASCTLVFGSESIATANAYGSMVTGLQTIADYGWMLVGGKYNKQRTDGTPLFVIGNGTSAADSDRSNAFEIFANGNAAVQNTISFSNGADYAEFFEWADGNPNAEDRVGLLVCLEGSKIRLAQSGDDVLGIISGTAAVLGDSAAMHWKGKYATDEYGRMLYDMVEEFVIVEDPKTKKVKTVSTGLFPHPRLNPDYDPEAVYTPREERPEWDKVGLLGKLYTRDDGTCVSGGYGCVGKDGVLTHSETKTNIRIMERTGENIVLVLMK